jgi:3',5'-cyclic AMP phosphodiesterase CpdA
MSGYIEHQPDPDDGDRRGFLKCMAWAGTGVVFTVTGCGVATTKLGAPSAARATSTFSFVQISDSHIGFDKAANTDVAGTLERCVARINELPVRPAFVIHTGDHVHLSTAAEFDTVKQILATIKTDRVFNVPGEHDVFVDQGRTYRQFFGAGAGARGSGWCAAGADRDPDGQLRTRLLVARTGGSVVGGRGDRAAVAISAWRRAARARS